MIYEQITIEKEKYDQLINDSIELVKVKKKLSKLEQLEKLIKEIKLDNMD